MTVIYHDRQLERRLARLREVIHVWERENLVGGAWLPTETLAVLDVMEAENVRLRAALHDAQLNHEAAVQACEDLQGELRVARGGSRRRR